MSTRAREGERGFTMLEVMIAIILTAIAVLGITQATIGALHAQSNSEIKSSLDDDALAVLSDVRMMTAYDGNMLTFLARKNASMNRTMANNQVETITVNVIGAQPAEYAVATASMGGITATERIELYQHAPAPGSVVNQQ